jgi:hypothetical protein
MQRGHPLKVEVVLFDERFVLQHVDHVLILVVQARQTLQEHLGKNPIPALALSNKPSVEPDFHHLVSSCIYQANWAIEQSPSP